MAEGMMEKICCSCKVEKPIDRFSWNNKAKGLRAKECKSCHRVARKKYYIENRDAEILTAREGNKRKYEWFRSLKVGLVCQRCPESHPVVLAFHHRDPDRKEFILAGAVRLGYSRERIKAEIAKCDVLCHNCHGKLHYEERHAA